MLNSRSTFTQNLNNRKGQVALFVALIFQILFLFFAMVINVGLLVHHKINLQNSVDLAAYYAASKQAENMNAIAHMNYQIRQSWKLLAWRYRMLGTAGEWHHHPYRKEVKGWRSGEPMDTMNEANSNIKSFMEAPPFCITYIPFKPMPPGENTCRDVVALTPIQLWTAPPVIAFHQSFSHVIASNSEALRQQALQRCAVFGSYNYLMLARFVVAYNLDQANRMEAIKELSRATSAGTDDFYDIDGRSVQNGVRNTLLKNLTAPNKASEPQVKMYNSLGHENCNAHGVRSGAPAKWLAPVRIYPGFRYIDTLCQATRIKPEVKEFSNNNISLPQHLNDPAVGAYKNDILAMKDWIGYKPDLDDNYNFSIGVEKNPWCMAYTGVSVTTQPKIPFSPFGSVKLKARAFYKPFGGRVGPWYYKNWRPGSPRSEGSLNEKTDPNMAPRVTDVGALSAINSNPAEAATRAANYSRFIGDNYGLKSFLMMGFYGKSIYELDNRWRASAAGTGDSIDYRDSAYVGSSAPDYEDWSDLPFRFMTLGSGSGDILAFDSKRNAPSTMRLLETAAILPDTFDAAYYSIEPDYYHNYYVRLRDGFFAGPGKQFLSNQPFRPDVGYRRNYKQGNYNYEEFSVKDQFEVIKDAGDPLNEKIKDIVKNQFTFTLSDWKHALSSWAPKSLVDYTLDPDKFGKCSSLPVGADDNQPNPPTAGNCAAGGTTGYAVKMVSSDYLRSSDLKLGGEAGGSGPLRNPPPDDSEF